MRRQAERQRRIQNGDVRDEGEVVDRVFVVRLFVGDDGGERRFAAGARGGRDGDHQRRLFHDAKKAAHVCHALIGLGNARAGNLGAVHRGAAAHGDDRLRAGGKIRLPRGFNVGDGRVGRLLQIDRAGNVRRGEALLQRAAKTQTVHAAVGDEEHGGNALFAQQGRDVAQVIELTGFAVGEERQRKAESQLISAAEKFGEWIHICSVFLSRVARGSAVWIQ